MVNKFQKKVLILALYAGELMMKNGAEIYRVEDTITRICKACRMSSVEVFATPTGVFVSIDTGGEEDDTQTYVKRIKGAETNLNKISKLNHFSREFTTTDLSVDEGMKRLKEIDQEKPYPFAVRLVGASIIASCFAMLFDGHAMDFAVAFVAGAPCYLFSLFLEKHQLNAFIRGFCCCALAAFITMLAVTTLPGASYEPILIGDIMIFVPGVAITNSIRDFLSGDMLAGTARLREALLTATSLALGVGVILKLWGTIGGVFV